MAYVTCMVVLLMSLKHLYFSWITSEGFLTSQKGVQVIQNTEELTLYVFYTPYIYSVYVYILYGLKFILYLKRDWKHSQMLLNALPMY